eukprot:scaffold12792_cov64-Phaeocystis_antarctica.AAC.3
MPALRPRGAPSAPSRHPRGTLSATSSHHASSAGGGGQHAADAAQRAQDDAQGAPAVRGQAARAGDHMHPHGGLGQRHVRRQEGRRPPRVKAWRSRSLRRQVSGGGGLAVDGGQLRNQAHTSPLC